MARVIVFWCDECKERFEASVLSAEEQRAAQARGQPTAPVRCPRCGGMTIRRV